MTAATAPAGAPATTTAGTTTAEHAHLEALLRACALEQELVVGPALTVPLPRHGLALHAVAEHASATGRHRFGPVALRTAGGEVVADPVDPVLAVALVAAELTGSGRGTGDVGDLAARAADSVRRVRSLLNHPAPPTEDGFLAAEQAMTLGHLHHPTPKSRDGITDAECLRWAPEAGGRFPLHWFAADAEVVDGEHLPGTADERALLTALADDATRRRAGDRVLVPAHPWQARDLLDRPGVAALVDSGALTALGPGGPDWFPTSSWRTMYRPDAEVMLKCSLGLRLTNSRRESTLTELRRGVEVARLLDAGFIAATAAAHPQFTITPDPSWLAVLADDGAGGRDVTGLDVAVRAVPAGAADLRCLAGLVAPAPGGAWLTRLVDDPREWVAHYVARVLVPCLHLHAATGIGLEGHQQNTLVRVAADGDVVGGAFRDNQGYYLAESRLPDVLAVTGAATSTLAVVPDALVEDRLSYYLLRNQALAVVGCLGEAGLADERDLLAVVRDELTAALPALAAAGPHGDRLARRWLTAPTLPAKANLATGFSGVDEVLAPLDTQSVYLDLANPLVLR